jgi:hypothetical protein
MQQGLSRKIVIAKSLILKETQKKLLQLTFFCHADDAPTHNENADSRHQDTDSKGRRAFNSSNPRDNGKHTSYKSNHIYIF